MPMPPMPAPQQQQPAPPANILTQTWLDQNQYTKNGIQRYSEIFGRTYVSTGGETTTKEFTGQLGLKPGMKVLDIGSGAGGSAFYMARTFGADVYGIDLSTNMVEEARGFVAEMEPEVQHRVQFHIKNALTMEYPARFYDVVYSRDAIMHNSVEDKLLLFKRFMKTLKPGGKIMISDYCHGDKVHSQRFTDYVATRDYKLCTVKQYGNILKKAGFKDIVAEDKTGMMIDIMNMELEKFERIKKSFIAEFSEKDYNDIVEGWREKLVRCDEGDQTWGFFIATA